jgi:hypothetical protein
MSIFDLLENPKMIHIYALIDPRENEQNIYIGATSDLKRRYRGHISAGKHLSDKSRKDLWINQLLKEELKPYLLLLEKAYMLHFEIWQFERVWEKVADQNGYKIQNENYEHWKKNISFEHRLKAKNRILPLPNELDLKPYPIVNELPSNCIRDNTFENIQLSDLRKISDYRIHYPTE